MNATKKRGKTGTRPAGKKNARSKSSRSSHRLWAIRCLAACTALFLLALGWTAICRARAPQSNTGIEGFDTLIVLGSKADGDGNPTPTQQARVTEAVHEYERGVAPHIIMSGGAAHNRFVEAEVMARAAEAQGIQASAIVIEPKAQSTTDNACNSLRIMRGHGWRSAEVISSSYHLPRAALIFDQLPIAWRVHAAPALEPENAALTAAKATFEFIKTTRYLLWTRLTESCQL